MKRIVLFSLLITVLLQAVPTLGMSRLFQRAAHPVSRYFNHALSVNAAMPQMGPATNVANMQKSAALLQRAFMSTNAQQQSNDYKQEQKNNQQEKSRSWKDYFYDAAQKAKEWAKKILFNKSAQLTASSTLGTFVGNRYASYINSLHAQNVDTKTEINVETIQISSTPQWEQAELDNKKQSWILQKFKYDASSVLPIYSVYEQKEGRIIDYVILTRENAGWAKDLYDDFGGARDYHEKDCLMTASREFWEENGAEEILHMTKQQTQEYVVQHTEYIIANKTAGSDINQDDRSSSMVTYITRFDADQMKQFIKTFARKCDNQAFIHYFWQKYYLAVEKDRIAVVRFEDLAEAAISKVYKVSASVFDASGVSHKEMIPVRPILLSKLRPFFEGKKYRACSHDIRVRFYNT